jgi:hypothetical protein
MISHNDKLLGVFITLLCVPLVVMLLSLVYCFAKLRVAALLPELAADEVIRVARFVTAPAFGIEALRMILALVFYGFDIGEPFFGPTMYLAVRVLPHGLTEILTVIAFAILVLRFYFSIRQLDRRRPGRVLVANGLLLIIALALGYCAAGVGIFWGLGATPFRHLAS